MMRKVCEIKRILVVFFLLFTPILSSCTGDDNPSGYEPYDTHPRWTDSNPDAFWEKQPGAFTIDTVWEGDTTLYF